MRHPSVVEHGSSSGGRWLRARRLKIALWIAVVEGLLVAVHVISWWIALPIAAALILFYLFVGRETRSDLVRQTSWIAAASQALMALVPILVIVIGTLTLIIVGVLAVVALVVLFADRR